MICVSKIRFHSTQFILCILISTQFWDLEREEFNVPFKKYLS